MAITRHRRSAVVFVAAALGSVASLALSSPAQALTISTFSDSADAVTPNIDAIFGDGSPATTLSKVGSSFAFQKSGIQVTFSNPLRQDVKAVSRSNTTLGTCISGRRPATVAVCGNLPGELNTPPDSKPEIDKITLTFNQAVKLISAAGVMRSVAGNNIGDNELSSVWKTSGSLDNVFSAINPQSTDPNGTVYYNPFEFAFNNFIAQVNAPVTVETSFIQGSLDYWMQNLNVEAINFEAAPVPGPLPLLGVGSAFAFSRRIRRRCKAARGIEFV
jgi:hypothetical protein